MEKRYPANYIVHSTAPAYRENRVLVSARDTTTTTYVVHAFFRPVPYHCYAGTCNSFNGSCVCDAESDPVAKPIVLEFALPRQGDVRHGIQLGLCGNEKRWPRLQRAKLFPVSCA